MCKQLSEGRIERKTLRLTKMSFVSKCTVQITTHFIQNHFHIIFISLKIAMIQQVYAIISEPSINLHGLNKQEFDDTFVLLNKMISNTNGSVCWHQSKNIATLWQLMSNLCWSSFNVAIYYLTVPTLLIAQVK